MVARPDTAVVLQLQPYLLVEVLLCWTDASLLTCPGPALQPTDYAVKHHGPHQLSC